MHSSILAFEILSLCIKEKMKTVSMSWVVDTAGDSNVRAEVGKEYYDAIKKYAKKVREYPMEWQGKYICKGNSFIDRLVFIIAGLDNEYINGICGMFYCADETIEKELIFSKKIYELLKI